jgi:hypothetical protein
LGSRISHSANPPTNDAAISTAMVSQDMTPDMTSARAISCAVPCSARIVARNGATVTVSPTRMVCSTMIGSGSAPTRAATLAISITPPGMAARKAVRLSTFTSRIRISAPAVPIATEIAAPTTSMGSRARIASSNVGMNEVPIAVPVTNCPAARACQTERTGTPASPSAAVVSSAPVM